MYARVLMDHDVVHSSCYKVHFGAELKIETWYSVLSFERPFLIYQLFFLIWINKGQIQSSSSYLTVMSLEQYWMVETPDDGYWLQSGNSKGEKKAWEVQKCLGENKNCCGNYCVGRYCALAHTERTEKLGYLGHQNVQ